jgi:hypothetical protein
MALKGSLREFSLADILQLIFFQKKTGILSLQGRDDKARLLFNEGNIIGAESRKRGAEKRLGSILVKRGIITEENMNAVIEKQKAEGGKFGAVLVKEGITSKEEIQDVIKFQITETIGQLFGWKDGMYEFIPQGVPIDKDIGLELDTQHFLMEGVRMVDEWSEIGHKITIESVYVLTDEEGGEITEEEREILAHVDGETDVGTISDNTGKDSFSVSTALLSLKDKGVIMELVEEEEGEEIQPRREMRPIPTLGVMLALPLTVALGVSLVLSIMATSDNLKESSASEKIDMLRYDVRIQLEEKGSYPAKLEALDPWSNPYIYNKNGNGFTITSSGPDGKAGTGDDIR